jgi:hypothetical protein
MKTRVLSQAFSLLVFLLCNTVGLFAKAPVAQNVLAGHTHATYQAVPVLLANDFSDDTLACFDLHFVQNNPQTVGRPGSTLSPLAAATGAQTIPYAEAPKFEEDNIQNLGYPAFPYNCRTTLQWSDKVVYYGCDSIRATGIYARIYRQWVATDCNGLRSSVVQVIPFKRPDVVLADHCAPVLPFSTDNQLQFRGAGACGQNAAIAAPNYDWVVAYTSCTPDKSLIKKADVMPSFRSYFYNAAKPRNIYLDEAACNYSIQIKDTEFPTCGGRGVQISRDIYVFDWCSGGGIDTFHVLIKIGDDQAPTLSAPARINGVPNGNPAPARIPSISTGPMDCTAAFLLSAAGLRSTFGYTLADNCTLSNLALSLKSKERYLKDGFLVATDNWEKGEYAILNGMIVGVPIGHHCLIIEATDACNNAMRDSFEFEVLDKVAPVMKCDRLQKISLSNGRGYSAGYAQVSAHALDAGSWDNCKLAWIKARRSVLAAAQASFIAQGYDTNHNGKLDAAVGKDNNADGDFSDEGEFLEDGYDGIDSNGDGDFKDFGETFVWKNGQLMTPLSDAVTFYCADLAAKVAVELWGEDGSGNRNSCGAEIQIEDNTAPACSAPFDLTVDCNEQCLSNIDNPQTAALCFGELSITSGNDCTPLDTTYTTEKDLKCGYGTIIRKWTLTRQTALGPISVTCAQKITVRPIHQYNITFPKDVTTDCNSQIIDTFFVARKPFDEVPPIVGTVDNHDTITLNERSSCDLLSVSVSEKRYDASKDECYQLFRTYTVTNWCTYDDRCGDPLEGSGSFTVPRDAFGKPGQVRFSVLVRDANRDSEEEFYFSRDLIANNADDQRIYPKICNVSGEYYHTFVYTQLIKVYDDESPVVTGQPAKFCIREGGSCTADVKVIVKGKDRCTSKLSLEKNLLMIAPYQTRDANLMLRYNPSTWNVLDLGQGGFEINVLALPQGKYDLIAVLRDDCGNLSLPTRIPFSIEDCRGPAPICLSGLSLDLLPAGPGSGQLTLAAADFVASKVFDCNGQGPETENGLKLVTKYSINREKETARPDQSSIVFTCADLESGFIVLELHAWDDAGNHDFCLTFVEIYDKRQVCPASESSQNTLTINGLVLTEAGVQLPGVSLQLSGYASMVTLSPTEGAFAFSNLGKGGDFTITPSLDKNHLSGVTTFDLVLIQKHILGLQMLSSPYKLIAADANKSRSITTLDLIQLRKLILNIDPAFSNNTSWRFVNAAYRFPNPTNPWATTFPESISLNNLPGNTSINFIAIKVGDVNGSAVSN